MQNFLCGLEVREEESYQDAMIVRTWGAAVLRPYNNCYAIGNSVARFQL